MPHATSRSTPAPESAPPASPSLLASLPGFQSFSERLDRANASQRTILRAGLATLLAGLALVAFAAARACYRHRHLLRFSSRFSSLRRGEAVKTRPPPSSYGRGGGGHGGGSKGARRTHGRTAGRKDDARFEQIGAYDDPDDIVYADADDDDDEDDDEEEDDDEGEEEDTLSELPSAPTATTTSSRRAPPPSGKADSSSKVKKEREAYAGSTIGI